MFSYYVAFKSIFFREVKRFTRIWVQTLIPPVIIITLYFVIFGNLMGKKIGNVSGFSYMQFILPGLIMMSVISNSYSNVASSFYSSKFQRSIEELIVAPIPVYVIIFGYVSGGIARGLSVGFLVTVVSLFFSKFVIHSFFLVFLTLFLTSMLFSLAGLINGICASSFDDISLVPTLVITPLTYFGGIFYSLDSLDDFWRNVSYFNPLVYIINIFRLGFLGITDISVYFTFFMLFFLIFVSYFFAFYLLQYKKVLQN